MASAFIKGTNEEIIIVNRRKHIIKGEALNEILKLKPTLGAIIAKSGTCIAPKGVQRVQKIAHRGKRAKNC